MWKGFFSQFGGHLLQIHKCLCVIVDPNTILYKLYYIQTTYLISTNGLKTLMDPNYSFNLPCIIKKPLEDTMNGLEAKKKPKDKKTKRNQQEVCTKVKPDTENGKIHPDVAKEEKKSSKKRKRLLSDENEDQSANMETNQTLEESKEDKVDEGGANGGDKSGSQKSVKKQRNGSAEMIDAFLRMKIDQVEFAHEKLQDNSYLAKNALHCSRLPAKKERRLHSAHSQSQLTARQPVATALSPRRSPSAGLPLSALAPHCFLVLFQAIWGCVWKVFWCQVEQTRKFLRAGCNTVCLLPKAAS